MTAFKIVAGVTFAWIGLGVLGAGLIWAASWLLGRRDDMEALIDATRENIPDYVPDEWVRNL